MIQKTSLKVSSAVMLPILLKSFHLGDVYTKKKILIRNLFISLAEIIQSTNINDIDDLFECLITVALSETAGKNHFKENTRCERAKLKLKERISYGNVSFNWNLDKVIKNDVHQELEGYILDDITNFAS